MPFPVDEKYIADAEKKLGFNFPEAFRERLKHQNGGEVTASEEVWIVHPVFDYSDRKRISRTASHILRETENAREWPGFPPTAVSVAENGTGDRLVFLPAPHDPSALSPAIYHWKHESGMLEPVALDFAELVSFA